MLPVGSENVPDISGHLEKTLTDSNFQKPLSDEAYSRFRKALGKFALVVTGAS